VFTQVDIFIIFLGILDVLPKVIGDEVCESFVDFGEIMSARCDLRRIIVSKKVIDDMS